MPFPPREGRVTIAIAVLTALAYLITGFGGPHLVLQAGFVPLRAVEPFPFAAVPFVLTPLSATLLHGGLLHLGFNLLMLIFCGRPVEKVLGGGRLALLYGLGAYGAAAAQYAVDPTSGAPMIGASGAVSALVAAYAMLFARGAVRAIGPLSAHLVRALWLAGAWIAIQWLIGKTTGDDASPIATAAHVGGFLVGLVLVRPLLAWRYRGA